jgi:hypothetical protein
MNDAGIRSGLPPADDIFHNDIAEGAQAILSLRVQKDMVTGRGLMALSHHSTAPVPLFLIPQALSEEIRKYGDAIGVSGARHPSFAYHAMAR